MPVPEQVSWSADFPPLRAHQQAALSAFRASPGDSRYQFILPPGSGKTLLGGVIAAELGRKTLVLVPNTAIAAQWLRLWRSAGVPVGEDRSLVTDVTVLTYQAIATFDDDIDEGTPMARLHTNARVTIDAIKADPEVTLILDEAHHLAATWGELLAQILDEVGDGPVVVALTATPRDSLSQDEARLVDTLFGPVRYAISTPALVRDGVLAPYRELVWFTEPTSAEREYLQQAAVRWQELVASVMSPGFATTGLLEYLDRAWVVHQGVSWSHVEKSRPELARALLRAAHNRLIAVPTGARLRDEHRQPMAVEDWVAILSDYGRTVLAAPDPPEPGWEHLRAGLRSVGWTLTRNGARRGQSSVDRVLARSGAKAAAAGYLVAQECLVRGPDLRAVVLTDFENVTATPPADIASVLAAQAGSAWEALARIQADNPTLRVVLVTGSSVGGAREVLERVRLPGHVVVDRPDGSSRIEGSWTPREWVTHVTKLFQSGAVDVLVGTRGLLGEGWDAPAANVLVDLTAATTSTAVVQIRGRAIRRDPQRTDKVAHVWSVTCVYDEHPRGDLDYRRLVAKHRGYLAPDADGRIVAGVEHLDDRCGAYAPPVAVDRAAINAVSLDLAGQLEQSRTAWQVGTPYRDVTEVAVRVRPSRRASLGVPEPAVRVWQGWPFAAGTAGAVGLGAVAVAAQMPSAASAAAVVAGSGLGWGAQALWRRMRASRIAENVGADGMLLAFGRAVAQAMGPGWAQRVQVVPGASGEWSVRLSDSAATDSARFAEAVEQVLSPVDYPRYLISRWIGSGRAVMWHAVPDQFGVNKAAAQSYAEQWSRFVSRGQLLYTGAVEGSAVAETVRGLDPMDVATAMYSQWG